MNQVSCIPKPGIARLFPTRDVHVLILEYTTLHGKGILQMWLLKYLDMRLSWFSGQALCNYEDLYGREGQGSESEQMRLWEWGGREYRRPPEAGEDKEHILLDKPWMLGHPQCCQSQGLSGKESLSICYFPGVAYAKRRSCLIRWRESWKGKPPPCTRRNTALGLGPILDIWPSKLQGNKCVVLSH